MPSAVLPDGRKLGVVKKLDFNLKKLFTKVQDEVDVELTALRENHRKAFMAGFHYAENNALMQSKNSNFGGEEERLN